MCTYIQAVLYEYTKPWRKERQKKEQDAIHDGAQTPNGLVHTAQGHPDSLDAQAAYRARQFCSQAMLIQHCL